MERAVHGCWTYPNPETRRQVAVQSVLATGSAIGFSKNSHDTEIRCKQHKRNLKHTNKTKKHGIASIPCFFAKLFPAIFWLFLFSCRFCFLHIFTIIRTVLFQWLSFSQSAQKKGNAVSIRDEILKTITKKISGKFPRKFLRNLRAIFQMHFIVKFQNNRYVQRPKIQIFHKSKRRAFRTAF